MLINTRILLAYVLCLACAYGCTQKDYSSQAPSPTGSVFVIENVPFVKQKDDFCGPAAMASVMAHYGSALTQEEVAEEVYTPALDGALISDMENFARGEGFQSKAENGSLERLKTLIDEGSPVILLVDRGKWRVSVPHYYVAYGYVNNGESYIIHSGYENGVEIDSAKLDSEWEKMNRLMLVVKE